MGNTIEIGSVIISLQNINYVQEYQGGGTYAGVVHFKQGTPLYITSYRNLGKLMQAMRER